MNSLARIAADKIWLGWLIVLVLGIPPLAGYCGVRVFPPLRNNWASDEDLRELNEVRRLFRQSASAVMVLECDDFFQPEPLRRMERVARDLRQMPDVLSVIWPGDIPEVTLRGKITPLLPSPDGTPEERRTAGERLLHHPLAAGQLISADGKTQLMLIDADQATNLQPIRDFVASQLEPAGIRVRMTGGLALYQLHERVLEQDRIHVQLLAYSLVIVLVFFVFRNPLSVIVAGSGPVVGVFWTIGWLLLLGQSENELAKIILPVMIMMLGFSDSVHLTIAIQNRMWDGWTRQDAVRQSILETGPACLLTALTTTIGFGSLMVAKSELISGFGRVSAIGTTVAFFSVIFVTPLMANTPLFKRSAGIRRLRPLNLMPSWATSLLEIPVRKPWPTALAGVCLTGICFVLSFQLKPGDRLIDRIPKQTEEFQSMLHCDEHMGGIRNLRLVVSWQDGTSKKTVWNAVADCEEVLRQEPRFGRPLSIRTCLNVFRGPGREDHFVLANHLPDYLREHYWSESSRSALVITRLRDEGIDVWRPLFASLEQSLSRIQMKHPGINIQIISDVLIEDAIVQQMIADLMSSLTTAAVIIFLVMGIAFRSLRIALVSIIPNTLPGAAAGALHLLISPSLSIASACSFAICLGIAVDDTIHFMNSYAFEKRRGESTETAIRHTFHHVGSAMIMTTVVLLTGLGSVLTSQLTPHVQFAAMGVTTLGFAMFADLILTPALLMLFPGRDEKAAVHSEDQNQPT